MGRNIGVVSVEVLVHGGQLPVMIKEENAATAQRRKSQFAVFGSLDAVQRRGFGHDPAMSDDDRADRTVKKEEVPESHSMWHEVHDEDGELAPA